MSKRYLGGFITKTPTAPTSSSASGIWTLEQQAQYVKAGTWPGQAKTVEIKVWGAGGGYGDYSGTGGENGGPGGYATATFNINPGTTLSIFVGQGGSNYTSGGDKLGGNAAGNGSGPSEGGKGGGFTGVFVGSQTWAGLSSISGSNALIIAGSGGGASYYSGGHGGGYGGGTSGGAGMDRTSGGSSTENGGGGSATAAGSGGGSSATSGSGYSGGSGGGSSTNEPGGGGGAGWYGGGGGGRYGGGGGGSGMIASITSGTSLPTGVNSVTGNSFSTQTGTAVTAPNNSDSDYVSGRGTGGISNPNTNGGDGYIVIYVNGSKTTYSYTGDVQTLTV